MKVQKLLGPPFDEGGFDASHKKSWGQFIYKSFVPSEDIQYTFK